MGVWETFKYLPELLKEAAQSRLGALCLMCLILAGLALVFFRNSPVWAKLVVFLFLLTGTVEFGYVTLHPEFKSQGMDATHESQGMDPTKKLPVQAGIETIRVAHESQRKNPTHKSPVQARTEAIRVAHESQGMKGSDDVGNIPTKLNSECPESTIYDWSKSPPESRIERRCS